MKNYLFIIALCLVGCGGTSFSTAPDDGMGGELNTGGTDNTGGKDSTGGIVDNTGGEDSSGGIPNSGGSTGGTETGGQPTGGSGGCVPKSCEKIAQDLTGDLYSTDACGKVDDGCGNVVDCGGCDDRPTTTCGGLIDPGLQFPNSYEKVYNQYVCSTGCIAYVDDHTTCDLPNMAGFVYVSCTDAQTEMPGADCTAMWGGTYNFCCNPLGAGINDHVRESHALPPQ